MFLTHSELKSNLQLTLNRTILIILIELIISIDFSSKDVDYLNN